METARIGVVTENLPVYEACRKVLGEEYRIELALAEPDDFAEPEELERPLDLALFDLGMTLRQGVAAFARWRLAHPKVPVILLARDIEADLAVELVKLGAADLLTLPPPPGALRAKVARALGGTPRPTFRRKTLLPFAVRKPGRAEQRRAFRATVPPGMPVRARLRLPGGYLAADVVDVSLEHEGQPGALLLEFSEGTPGAAALTRLPQAAECPFELRIPQSAVPLQLQGSVVRTRPATQTGMFHLVLRYRPVRGEQARALGRFWMDCQAGGKQD